MMKTIKEDLTLSGKDKISEFPHKFNKLLGVVERLVSAVSFLLAAVATLLIQAVFEGKLVQFFASFNFNWSDLSEGYQLLILGVPIAILVGVGTHFVNKKYIDPLVERKRD